MNEKLQEDKRNWKHNEPKHTEHSKRSPKEGVSSSTYLLYEIKIISNKVNLYLK